MRTKFNHEEHEGHEGLKWPILLASCSSWLNFPPIRVGKFFFVSFVLFVVKISLVKISPSS